MRTGVPFHTINELLNSSFESKRGSIHSLYKDPATELTKNAWKWLTFKSRDEVTQTREHEFGLVLMMIAFLSLEAKRKGNNSLTWSGGKADYNHDDHLSIRVSWVWEDDVNIIRGWSKGSSRLTNMCISFCFVRDRVRKAFQEKNLRLLYLSSLIEQDFCHSFFSKRMYQTRQVFLWKSGVFSEKLSPQFWEKLSQMMFLSHELLWYPSGLVLWFFDWILSVKDIKEG